MWIRSQNKLCLINANDLWVDGKENDIVKILANNSSISEPTGSILGKYSKERAIEILDNIQDTMINSDGIINDIKIKCYEMPKE